MSKVSVIIPAYNSAKYLSKTIDSVLAQTYQHYEIIIVNDGSSDSTEKIAEEYLRKYPEKIRYFYQKNRGTAAARNHAIKKARGTYIAFLDADDMWLPHKLKMQCNFMDKNFKYALVFSNAYLIDEKNREFGIYVKDKYFDIKKEEMFNCLLVNNFVPFSSVLVRRSTLNKIGYSDELLMDSEDYDLLLRIAEKYYIGFMNSLDIKYRVSSSNKVNNLERRHLTTINVLTKFYKTNAIRSSRVYISLRKRLAICHYYLGYTLFEKNSFKEARKIFKKAISIWPFCNIKYYILLIATILPNMLPKKSVNKLRHIKRRVWGLINA